ncbi:MAG: universal stress protein [Deltaproteobacteria bacterium]|jgi:nucleotide-binding universal stress UspA family protein|nr:universal stress protein [Deltaproteobacteria bacterium]MBK7069282.1 universal stress protein [Deltaproteobacteria bacterium]MBK8696806.1 universal stress protein [Deltaproteobacteria bacterium]MBP6832243.1 universal stress protein [Deltaproteobacteria bacterium]
MLRLLVALDFSDCSPLTLHTALEVAARGAPAELHVMTVIAPDPDDLASMSSSEHACDELRRLVETERGHHGHSADVRLQFSAHPGSSPAEIIVAHARAIRADAVVVGTHGRRGLDRLLLGSVAEAVVRHAPCSVLTVKPPLRHIHSD